MRMADCSTGDRDDRYCIETVLDQLHAAAAQSDIDNYFCLFTEDAVFIGTDITERWTLPEFKEWAVPVFQNGAGWAYYKISRHIHLSPEASTAWFDEILENKLLGSCRGSGVLSKTGNQWKVAMYHLTVPVPNEIVSDVVQLIQAC